MQKGFGLTNVFIVVAIVVAGAVWYLYPWQTGIEGGNEEITACPQDAMQCPDGSYVGRTGPNCEFAECQTLSVGQEGDTSDWQTYRNEEYGFEFRYPNDWMVTETKLSNDHPSSYLKVRITVSNNPIAQGQKLSKENVDEISAFEVTFRGSQNEPKLDIEKWYDVSEGKNEIISKRVATIAGRKAVCTETSWQDFIIQRCFVSDETSIVEIGYSLSQPKFVKDYENILSTFKFIE